MKVKIGVEEAAIASLTNRINEWKIQTIEYNFSIHLELLRIEFIFETIFVRIPNEKIWLLFISWYISSHADENEKKNSLAKDIIHFFLLVSFNDRNRRLNKYLKKFTQKLDINYQKK